MSLCLPGFQGFPIQVTGWQSIADKEDYIVPSDISLQFSPENLPIKRNDDGSFILNGSHTFFMGGTQYFVNNVRICAPKQEGISSTSAKPIAEFHIWGLPTATSVVKNSLALLNIPIYQGTQTKSGDAFAKLFTGQVLQLNELIPMGKDVDVIRYSTCVESDQDYVVNIVVGYWSAGTTIDQSYVRFMPSPLPRFGVPQLSTYKLLSSYVMTEPGKGQRVYKLHKNKILEPYSVNIVLSAVTSEFRKGFRYIRGFVEKIKTPQMEASNLKCVSINREKDIVNGKLQIDPSTGKRLSEVDAEANEEIENSLDAKEVTISPKKIMDTIFIILGVIIGTSLLIMVGYLVYYGLVTRKSLGIPPIDPKTIQTTTCIGPLASN